MIRHALDWQKQTSIYTWIGAWMPANNEKGDDYNIAEQLVFAQYVSCELTKNNIPFAFKSDIKLYVRLRIGWISGIKPVLDEITRTDCM
jgi:hypothetical protein